MKKLFRKIPSILLITILLFTGALSVIIPSVAYASTSLNISVTGVTDDARYYYSAGWQFSTSDGNGAFIGKYDANNYYGVGLRFAGVTVPQGAVITTAYISFRADGTQGGSNVNGVIKGHDVDNSSTFSTATDFKNRFGVNGGTDATTTASVNWNITATWNAGSWYNSPEIKTIAQEIVDRGGWSSGNAMTFVVNDWSQASSNGNYRSCDYRDYSLSYSPILHIEYNQVPAVTTLDAGDLATTTATLNGNLTSLGGYSPVYVYFQYGLTTSYGTTTAEQEKTATGTFNQAITGLTANTQYHFRTVIKYNTSSYVYGSDNTFTTASAQAPTVSTSASSNVTTTTATLNGNITSMGAFGTVYAYFEYGLTTSYGYTTSEQTLTSTGSYHADITTLNAGATYHYRARVRYSATQYTSGSDTTFTTTSPPVSSDRVRFEIQSSANDGGGWSLGAVGWSNGAAYQSIGAWSGYTQGSMYMRFQVYVDPGTTISAAYLGVQVRQGASIYAYISAEDVANSAVITSGADQASRTRTNTKLLWYMSGMSTLTRTKSINISSVIQYIINKPTWQSGNYITIFVEDSGSMNSVWENICTFDGELSGYNRPYLELQYASVPKLTTSAATSVADTSVILNGYVNSPIPSSSSYWIQDPANPVFTDPAYPSTNAPCVILVNGVYYVYYFVQGPQTIATQHYVRLATGNSLYNLTVYGTILSPTGVGWNANGLAQMDVWVEGSTWHMLVEGFTIAGSLGGTWTIGHYISTDGINWVEGAANPVISFAGGVSAVGTPSVLIDSDGSYKVYVHAHIAGNPGSDQIALAYGTNIDNLTHKVIDTNAIVLKNSPNEWDGVNCGKRSVVKLGTTYYMIYEGMDNYANWRLGLATSPDGFVWTKQGMVVDMTALGSNVEVHMMKWGANNPNNLFLYTSGFVPYLAGDVSIVRSKVIDVRGFEYATNPSFTGSTFVTEGNEGTPLYGLGSFSRQVTGLTAGITYYYRAVAYDYVGWGYGATLTFTTSGSSTLPVASTNDATSVASTTTTLQGTLSDMGEYSDVYVSFSYGITPAFGTNTAEQHLTSTGDFSQAITGLTAGVTYYYQANARYSTSGYVNGYTMTFTTIGVPTVITGSATSIGTTTVTLGATLFNIAGHTSVSCFFQYGTTTSYSANTSGSATTLTAAGTYNNNVSSLSNSTTYHFRAVVDYGGVYAYGADMTFTTLATGSPTVVTNTATSVTTTTATLNGNLTSLGSYSPVYVYFQYGLTTSYGTTTAEQSQTATTTYLANITGLSQGTTYHYRTVIRYNSTNYIYGDDTTFTTLVAGSPNVVTNLAISITASGATLQGTISSMGSFSSVFVSFDYGTTSSYGYSTIKQTLTTAQAFSATITGLNSNTQYHFRAVVEYGASYELDGADATFTTLSLTGLNKPTNVNVTSYTATTITLSWAKGVGTTDTVIRYSFSGYPTSATEGYAAYLGTASTYTHTGLTTGSRVYYSLWGKSGSEYSTTYATVTAVPTSDALAPPDILNIETVQIYSDYVNVGDELIVFSTRILWDNNDQLLYSANDFFYVQIWDGSILVKQDRIKMWGYVPGSLYISSLEPLTWGKSYTFKISGTNMFATAPSVTLPISTPNYIGNDYSQLTIWARDLALRMQDSPYWDTLIETGGTTSSLAILNTTGSQIFLTAIPGINTKCPDLFYPEASQADYTPASTVLPYAEALQERAETSHGVIFWGQVESLAATTGLSTQVAAMLMWLFFYGVCVIFIMIIGNRHNAQVEFIQSALFSSPVLVVGVMWGGIPMGYLIAVAIIMLGLFVWNKIAATGT